MDEIQLYYYLATILLLLFISVVGWIKKLDIWCLGHTLHMSVLVCLSNICFSRPDSLSPSKLSRFLNQCL